MADEKDVEKMRKRIAEAMQDADDAYWAVIVKHFPEVKSGDFPPDANFEWGRAQEDALYTWLGWNHPKPKLMEALDESNRQYRARGT